jgi:hypothetical protein
VSKAYQYATNDDKVDVGLKDVNMSNAQTSFAKDNHVDQKNQERGGTSGKRYVLKVG